MRCFTFKKNTFTFQTEVKHFFEKQITKFGNGAKIDAPKNYIGKKVIVLVLEE
jgi:putative transposon-encoded protein